MAGLLAYWTNIGQSLSWSKKSVWQISIMVDCQKEEWFWRCYSAICPSNLCPPVPWLVGALINCVRNYRNCVVRTALYITLWLLAWWQFVRPTPYYPFHGHLLPSVSNGSILSLSVSSAFVASQILFGPSGLLARASIRSAKIARAIIRCARIVQGSAFTLHEPPSSAIGKQ